MTPLEEDKNCQKTDSIDVIYVPLEINEMTDEEDIEENIMVEGNLEIDIAGTYEVQPNIANENIDENIDEESVEAYTVRRLHQNRPMCTFPMCIRITLLGTLLQFCGQTGIEHFHFDVPESHDIGFDNKALQLAVNIYMFLNTLKNDKYVSVPEIAFDFSELVDSGLILGTFLLTNFTISGLDTLTSDLLNIQSTLDEDGYNYVCVYIPTEYLTLTTEYDADIGVADEIPLYGEGTFRYTLSDIDYNVCLTADFDVGYVYNVVAHLLYRHNPIELTGWWRNRQATEIIEKLVNVLDMLFAMWSSYNPNHASCVISPIIQYLVNNNIEYENNTITFNTTCLQEILTEVNHDETSNLEYKLFSTMKTNNDDIVLDSFLDKNQYTVVDWIKSAFSYITNVLDNE